MPHDHDKLIDQFYKEWKPVFENSQQPMYAYLDDTHKVCNENFSSLLGFASPKQWASVSESFPEAFVAPKSRDVLVTAYREAMEELVGSDIDVTWKKKNRGTVESKAILVPVLFQNHLFAVHFIQTEKKKKSKK